MKNGAKTSVISVKSIILAGVCMALVYHKCFAVHLAVGYILTIFKRQ